MWAKGFVHVHLLWSHIKMFWCAQKLASSKRPLPYSALLLSFGWYDKWYCYATLFWLIALKQIINFLLLHFQLFPEFTYKLYTRLKSPLHPLRSTSFSSSCTPNLKHFEVLELLINSINVGCWSKSWSHDC